MISRVLLVIAVIAGSCSSHSPAKDNKPASQAEGTPIAVSKPLPMGLKTDSTTITDKKKSEPAVDSPVNCEQLLFSIVDKSSFNPDIKKYPYKVWIDTVEAGVARLKITMKNEETDQDMIISWLDLDMVHKKLTDINGNKPLALKFDTSLLGKFMRRCRIEP